MENIMKKNRYRLKTWNELNLTQKTVRTVFGGIGLLIGFISLLLIVFMIYATIYVSMPINAF